MHSAPSRRARRIALVLVVLAAVSATPGAAGARIGQFDPATLHLQAVRPTTARLPVLSAPEAIAALNRQRTENGIPGDLVEEPRLSTGCLSWATSYHDAAGQYPHEEIPGQPGYTPEGSEAAGESDLAGEPSGHGTIGTTWGPQFNPWSGAALHEAALMDPFATSAWYGASQPAACMGPTGSRAFSAPAFYSFPGPGAKGVPLAVKTGELPFSPQQATGLGS
jgi:hypothetical protein